MGDEDYLSHHFYACCRLRSAPPAAQQQQLEQGQEDQKPRGTESVPSHIRPNQETPLKEETTSCVSLIHQRLLRFSHESLQTSSFTSSSVSLQH